MEKDALLANLKCEISANFSDEKIEKDFMIDNCVDLGDRDLKTKENSLLIDLIENMHLLNYTDECGNQITNCDFTKIKEFN